MKLYFLILLCVCFYQLSSAQLMLSGVKCGSKNCAAYEYCSQFHNTCEQCAKICNPKDVNVEVSICERDCQDFLFDKRYGLTSAPGRGSSSSSGNKLEESNLKDDVQKLHTLVIVTLTLTVFTLIVLAGLLIVKVYKYVIDNEITLEAIKNYFSNSDDGNNKTSNSAVSVTTASGKHDLRLDIPSAETQSGLQTPATMTTSISRRPAEDSTLDYAYDNPAMSAGTPSPHGGKPAPRGSHF